MALDELDVVVGVESEEVAFEVADAICPAAGAHLLERRLQEPLADA